MWRPPAAAVGCRRWPTYGACQPRVTALARDKDHPALTLDCVDRGAPLGKRQAGIICCNRVNVRLCPECRAAFAAPAAFGQEMGDVADWRKRILRLRIRNVAIDIDLRGDHAVATPDVQNHAAAVR